MRSQSQPDIDIDLSAMVGRARPYHGINLGPISFSGTFDTSAYFNHDDPYVRYFNLIIMLAVKDHGSELRLEPAEDSYEMRLLVDDQYYEMVPAPADIHGFISQAVKVIAGFDMSESARQEGEIDIRTKIESVRTTVSLEPTEYGDTIVLQFGKKIGR